ncbi:MAG TPA: hypothetical protein VJ183_10195 [Chloroflexia bacterium]|nr:hypothetical protein [Chloroflexia bacterium]
MDSEWNREQDWFWEGNVQERVIEYMRDEEGFTILSPGHPGGTEQGLEIVSERTLDNITVQRLVTVRGWPSPLYTRGSMQGQPRTVRPEATARGWIAQAVLELALGRGASPELELALALPAMASYIRYIQRLRWFMSSARVSVYLVSQDGAVSVTPPGAAPVSALMPSNIPMATAGTRRKLGLPGASRLQIPLLHAFVASGGELSRVDAIPLVARWFPEVPQPIPAEFGQRVSVAQRALQVAGQSELTGRGMWRITDEGRARHDAEWEEWQRREER